VEPWLALRYAGCDTALLFHLILEIIAAVLSGLRGYLLFVAVAAAIPIFLVLLGFLINRLRSPSTKKTGGMTT